VQGRVSSEGEQRREALLGMHVVGREELDRYGDNSVLDVLQRVPGITLDGEVPQLRGMGGGYTQILINGEPAPPGFSLDTLAPADIERIEVLKGPTAEFGGVAGTINVILRHAPKLRQREARLAVGYRALAPQGSTNLSWGDRVGADGALSFHLPLSLFTWANAGDLLLGRQSVSPVGEWRDQLILGQDRWRGRGFNFTPKLDYKLSATDTFSWQTFVQANRSDNRSQRATEVLAGPPQRTVDESSRFQGQWQMLRGQWQWVRKSLDGTRLELKASAQGSLSQGSGRTDGRDATGAPTVLRENGHSVRESVLTQGGRWRLPLGGDGPLPGAESLPFQVVAHTLVLGWDVDQRQRRELRRSVEDGVERVTGALGVPFTADLRRLVVFVQDEWLPAPRWSLLWGLRSEALDTTTTGPQMVAQQRQTALLPMLNLRHAWDDKGRDVLRLGVARSLRAPDVGLLLPRYTLNGAYERDTTNTPVAADFAGNPYLRPESSLGLDLAFEKTLAGGAVFSAGVFHRQIKHLIRRRIALETVAEASVPRWVSRPDNFGQARSSGLELEIKGRAEELLPAWFDPKAKPASGLQLRASLSLYRSHVEQIDDPDARLEGQAPWGATLGFDHALAGTRFSYGANMGITPGFSTQQTDRTRQWRGGVKRLDAYALWRVDRQTQFRLAGNHLAVGRNLSRSRVDAPDGSSASSFTRREVTPQFTLSWVQRF
jgi:outer membrane receptor for ferrienterochelin and colicins